jgi:hypothetical protein
MLDASIPLNAYLSFSLIPAADWCIPLPGPGREEAADVRTAGGARTEERRISLGDKS